MPDDVSVNETQTMSAAEIEEFALRHLKAVGTREENAAPLARAVAAAERDGIASHGLMYLPTYMEHVVCGKVDGAALPQVTTPRPGTVLVDAATGFAHPAIAAGLEPLLEAARGNGVALCAVMNSYNCGVLGFHTEAIATHGLLALGFTNAPASIAPVGGRNAVVGTNPLSLAVPDGAGGAAILIDQSASVVAKSEVMKRAREGRELPDGWALGPDGEPTRDADLALKGTMAPAGGYKGFGLGLLTEVMAAALTGANLGIDAAPFSGTKGGPPKTGHLFLAIDAGLVSGGLFAERIAALAAAIADQPEARLPGERRLKNRQRADADGIAVPAALLDKIREAAPSEGR